MAAKKPASKKTTTTTVEEAPTTPLDGREELDVFERARLEFSGAPRVKLTIYRYDDGETSYLKRVDYDPEAIDEEWIRKKWGPGSYQLRFSDSENTELRWSKVIAIASDAPPNTQPQSAGLGETFLLNTLQRQNEIMLQALVGGGRGAAASTSPGGSDALVKLIEGMQLQNNTLLQSSLNRPDTSATLLSVFEKGLQLASDQKLEAEGGWVAQIGRIAKDLLPALQELGKMRVNMPAIATPGGGAPPSPPKPNDALRGVVTTAPPRGLVSTAPSSPAPATVPPALSTSTPISMDDVIREFAPQILQAVQAGASAPDVADAILEAVPPMYYSALDGLTVERLLTIEPQLSQHRQFIVELVENMKEQTSDEESSTTPAAN